MNNFKEWLSDNLRYILLGLIILLVIGAAILGINIYSNIVGSPRDGSKETIESTETESKMESETETYSERETQTESQTESETESATGPETEPATEPETEPVTEPITEAPTEAETEPPTEPQPVYLTMQGSCYLRAEASMEAEIIGEYWAGTTVEFLEDVGGWYRVRVDGMTGYMGARFF